VEIFVIGAAIVSIIATVVVGTYIAESRGRHPAEGVALGCLLGPVGWMISLWLPERSRSEVPFAPLQPTPVGSRPATPELVKPEARYFVGRDEADALMQARGWLSLRSAAGFTVTEAAWMDTEHRTLAVATGRPGQPVARRWPDHPDVAGMVRGDGGTAGVAAPRPAAAQGADVPPPVADDRPTRICPRCAQRIFAAATMCRYCQLELGPAAGS
jgi:hypothetical protein